MSYLEWSTTAANNATADANINWAEAQAPGTVNNSSRAEMAAMASFFQGIGGALTTSGTGSAYTLTLTDAPTAYTTSMLFLVNFHAVSASTTATINVNSLGAKTLVMWDGTALPSATYIPVNAVGFIKYDGTNMRVFLPSIAYTQGATDVAVADGGTGASTAAGARTNLGAAPTAGSSSITTLGTVTTGTWNATAIAVAFGGTGATTAAGARTNLGLGTIATQAASAVAITGGTVTGITDLAVADGGTGASTAADARTNLGAAPLASPTFTGTVTMPTTNFGTSTTQWGTFSATGATAGAQVGVAAQPQRRDSSVTVTTGVSHLRFFNPNGQVGDISTSGASTAFNTTSDGALKRAVVNVDKAAAATILKAARPVDFEFIGTPGVRHYGFIAQEMFAVVPNAVTQPEEPGQPWMMDHSKLVPVLWAVVQDLLARVEALESA